MFHEVTSQGAPVSVQWDSSLGFEMSMAEDTDSTSSSRHDNSYGVAAKSMNPKSHLTAQVCSICNGDETLSWVGISLVNRPFHLCGS